MKILIIRLTGMREILLTTPIIRCLHQQLPEATIHYLVNHDYKEIISSNPYIQHLHDLQFNKETQIAALKMEAFDHILDLQKDAASKPIVDALIRSKAAGIKPTFLHGIFKTFKALAGAKPSPGKQYFESAAALGVKDDEGGVNFFIPKGATVSYKDIPASHGAGYIALAVGDSNWAPPDIDKLKAICAAIQHPIIIVGAKSEAAIGEALRAGDSVKVYNACGKFSFYESADLLHKSKLVITPESGWMYTAAALKKEMIVLAKSAAGTTNLPALYNKAFLKSLDALPFDSIPFYKKETDANAVWAVINARLKRKP